MTSKMLRWSAAKKRLGTTILNIPISEIAARKIKISEIDIHSQSNLLWINTVIPQHL